MSASGRNQGRIVQGADFKTDQIRARRNLHIERRAAIAAEHVTYRLGVP